MTHLPQDTKVQAESAAELRPPLTYDLKVDVCVVGGGLAGLWVAWELTKRRWSVAVLEAERVGAGQSSRSGLVEPGFPVSLERILDRTGENRAKAMWRLSADGVEKVREATAKFGIPHQTGLLSVATSPATERLKHRAELYNRFGTETELWSMDRVRDAVHTRSYFDGLANSRAFAIDPLTLARALATAIEQGGGRIFEGTPVRTIDGEGLRKRVDTKRGRVRADHVVLATGPHFSALRPALAATLRPLSSGLAITAPCVMSDVIRYKGVVSETNWGGNTFQLQAEDRLIWRGRLSTRAGTPQRLASALQREIRRVFPELTAAHVLKAEPHTMAYAVHGMPQIGEIAPGLWTANAFGGHGLNTTAMAGELIARGIAENDDTWRLFSVYELVWAGGDTGRVATELILRSLRARDRVRAMLARTADATHRRRTMRRRQASEIASYRAEKRKPSQE